MMRQTFRIFFLVFTVILLVSCSANQDFKLRNKAVAATQYNIAQEKNKATKTEPAVLTRSGFYVDQTPMALNTGPKWLKNRIRFKGANLPFSFIVEQILRNTSATVSYDPDVQTTREVSMDYRGTIKGALDNLAAESNYAYEVNGSQIRWANFVTKIFDISFMPGASNYLVGQTAGNSAANSSDTDISTMKGNLDDEQYSSLTGNVSVWNDLRKTLDDLKSKDGKVDISEATTTVTVRDHPSNVAVMAKYIQTMNKDLSRQVQLQVKVLQIDLDKAHQYGIDWNLAWKVFHSKLAISGNLFDNLSTGGAAPTSNPFGIKIGGNSNALINALDQQGKVSIVTEPSVTTLNNQVAEIRISKDTGYLKKVETTVSSGVGGFASTTLDPGIVTDGFALYLLPKIQNGRVYLQISSTLSDLKRIDTVTSSAGTTSTDSKDQGETKIELPTLAEKRFNIRSLVNNGKTLVIAGFKQLRDSTSQNHAFDIPVLGSRASEGQNTETIILITPIIVENKI